ncbi:hypothetical protein HYC85_015979 [Camellia sinensis]|uniref:Uncharacterized protein n=1 Tax=Camellia sinensis TaxID=4442 RepID=A0A7J7H0F7_CAMSI|nr:hypothetical protein HYC85_015979 [Camellia sinensis]
MTFCLGLLLLWQVRRLEAQGVPSKQAEAIIAAITEVLNDSLENVAHSFVSKAEMQKTDMLHESNLSKLNEGFGCLSEQGENDLEIYDLERTVGHTASASPKPAVAGDSNCNNYGSTVIIIYFHKKIVHKLY